MSSKQNAQLKVVEEAKKAAPDLDEYIVLAEYPGNPVMQQVVHMVGRAIEDSLDPGNIHVEVTLRDDEGKPITHKFRLVRDYTKG